MSINTVPDFVWNKLQKKAKREISQMSFGQIGDRVKVETDRYKQAHNN